MGPASTILKWYAKKSGQDNHALGSLFRLPALPPLRSLGNCVSIYSASDFVVSLFIGYLIVFFQVLEAFIGSSGDKMDKHSITSLLLS